MIRQHQGSTFTPARSMARAGDGLWCADCRSRHGYSHLEIGFRKKPETGSWETLWFCSTTGRQLQ